MTTIGEIQMLDITAPEQVQVLVNVDGSVLWVNIDGVCRLRVCRMTNLELMDSRKWEGP